MQSLGLNVLMFGVGFGVFLVCVTWSVKVLYDLFMRHRPSPPQALTQEGNDQRMNDFERKLHDLRNTTFGPRMTQGQSQTWPTVKKKTRPKVVLSKDTGRVIPIKPQAVTPPPLPPTVGSQKRWCHVCHETYEGEGPHTPCPGSRA